MPDAPPATPVPRPSHWPYRADPPGRYWNNYELYQMRGGLVRLEDDIKGYVAGGRIVGDISRFYFFCVAFDQMMKEGVRGDIAELGVYKGNTATVLASMARRMGTTAWLLDTFEGFNQDDLKDIDAGRRLQFADTSLEAVRALVGEASVRYVKGYFPQSASQMPDDLAFSLVHIDCDLYVPIMHALNYFYPRVLPGGYLIVHDYASLGWKGAEQAVDEFFADKPEQVIPLTDGCGSAVVRKVRHPADRGNWLLRTRRARFSDRWASAAQGGLLEILGSGWSECEPWGIWCVGAAHTLTIYLEQAPADDVMVEVECAAALLGSRRSQDVAVYASEQLLAVWHFSEGANRAQRSVSVPAGLAAVGQWQSPVIRLEFRPREVAPIRELDPNKSDERTLGLALLAIRRGAAGQG